MSDGKEPAMDSWMPAFPCSFEHHNIMASGLTKREYFAGLAMQGLIELESLYTSIKCATDHPQILDSEDSVLERVARNAVSYADALLKALSVEEEKR